MMARAFLSIGCNMGDCRGQLESALTRLQDDESTTLARISSVYITEPVGNKDQPDFFNIAVEIETGLEPLALLRFCRNIEERLGGRVGREDKGPRTIDLDILLYEQVEMSTAELVLPHPRMTERGFVLVPLAEISPELLLPEGNTVADTLAQLTDPHRVEKSGKLNGFSGGKLG